MPFKFNNLRSKASFTLVELIVVVGILAILTVVTVTIINPAEYFRQGRDTQRISDLNNVQSVLAKYIFSGNRVGTLGASNTIYISIADPSSPSCEGLGLPELISGWFYHCVTNPGNLQNNDGTGWIPVDISGLGLVSSLPIDPTNATSTGNYYSYTPGANSWELWTVLESAKDASLMQKDGGADSASYEIGTNLALKPQQLLGFSVLSASPTGGYSGTIVYMDSITGSGFVYGASVKLTKSGQSDIVGSGFNVTSPTLISGGLFDLTGAVTGNWNIVVTNPNLQSASLVGGFTVD